MAVLETLQQAVTQVQEQQTVRESVSTALREHLSSLLENHTSRRVPKYGWSLIALSPINIWFVYPIFCLLSHKILNPVDIVTERKLTRVVENEGEKLKVNISSGGDPRIEGITVELERASRLRLLSRYYYPDKVLEQVTTFDPQKSQWGLPRPASTEELLVYQQLVGEVQRSLSSKPRR